MEGFVHISSGPTTHTLVLPVEILSCDASWNGLIKHPSYWEIRQFKVEKLVFSFWMKNATLKHQPHCILSEAPVPFVVLPFVASTLKKSNKERYYKVWREMMHSKENLLFAETCMEIKEITPWWRWEGCLCKWIYFCRFIDTLFAQRQLEENRSFSVVDSIKLLFF